MAVEAIDDIKEANQILVALLLAERGKRRQIQLRPNLQVGRRRRATPRIQRLS